MLRRLRRRTAIPTFLLLLLAVGTAAYAVSVTITITLKNCGWTHSDIPPYVDYTWDVDIDIVWAAMQPSNLQTAVLVPTAFPSPSSIGIYPPCSITFVSDSVATAKVQALHPAPAGKKWIGFKTNGLVSETNFQGNSRISFFWSQLPSGSETETGGVWFSSNADVLHGDTVTEAFSLLPAPPEYVKYRQLRHTELGAASLAPSGSNLVVSNLGSSGNDGVQVSLPDRTERYTMAWQDLGTAATTNTGDFLKASATGIVNNKLDQPLGSLQVTDNGALLQVTADYSPIGSATARVEVYNNGALQGAFTGMSGTLATFTPYPRGCRKWTPNPGQLPCYWLDWPISQSITIPGHGTFTGNELAILVDSPTATLGTLSSFSLQSKNITPIVETDATPTGNFVGFPLPTLSEWGMLALVIGLSSVGFLILRRRRTA